MKAGGSSGRAALLVDAAGELAGKLRPALEARGYEVCALSSALEALRVLVSSRFDVVVCDLEGLGLARSAFESAVQRAQPALAGRVLFIAPTGAEVRSSEHLVCTRPLDVGEVLRHAAFLSAPPLAPDDSLVG